MSKWKCAIVTMSNSEILGRYIMIDRENDTDLRGRQEDLRQWNQWQKINHFTHRAASGTRRSGRSFHCGAGPKQNKGSQRNNTENIKLIWRIILPVLWFQKFSAKGWKTHFYETHFTIKRTYSERNAHYS